MTTFSELLYLWVSCVSRGRVRQRLEWGRCCHPSALATLFFVPLRPRDPVVGRRGRGAVGLRLALRRGLLHLLERLLYDRRSAWHLRHAVGWWCPVGEPGLRLGVHAVPGNGQTQAAIHRLDLTQLCRLKFLRRRVGWEEMNPLKFKRRQTSINSRNVLTPWWLVGKRAARSSLLSLSARTMHCSSQNVTFPAWWSGRLHSSSTQGSLRYCKII